MFMPDGRICIIKDNTLREGSKIFQVFENILYEGVGIDPGKVAYCTISQSLSLKDIQADVIIVVGEKVFNQVCNLRGITKYTGRVIEGMIPVVPIVSPTFLEYNPNYMVKYAEDIQTAYHVSIGISREEATNQYKIVEDFNTLQELIGYIEQVGWCSLDFETTELTDKATFDEDFYPTCLSLSFQIGSSYVIPLWHEESPWSDEDLKQIFYLLEKHIFGNPNIVKIGHNLKFDYHVAAWAGVRIFRGAAHDTMTLHQLHDENSSHKLKDIIRTYYSRFANYEKDLGTKNWAKIPLKTLAKYNALDSDLTLRLYFMLLDIFLFQDDGRIYQMFRNLTAPATKVLFHMEENGMLVDKAFLTESIRQVDGYIADQEKAMHSHPEVRRFEEFKTAIFRQARIDELQKKYDEGLKVEYKSKQAKENQVKRLNQYLSEIQQLKTGLIDIEPYQVNFSSPEQLKELFFTKEGFNFDPPKKTYGLPADSTGADNLSLIKDKTGFIEELQIYRQLSKISSTYLSSILEKLDNNHYIHTNFNQQVTKTGRLSSNKPNLQNIISRTKYKIIEDSVALVKRSFIPPEGYTLVQADYSQMELRIMAHFASEDNMLKAYNEKQDLHEITAANSLGYTLEEFRKLDPKVYKQRRFEAKAENFGFIYGMSAEGFKEYARTDYGITISLKEAEKKREAFFKKYPKLNNYYKEYISKARKFGYVRTFFGRKIHLPEITSINGGKRGHAERNAINGPIQGTAGEMTILALSLLHNRLDPRVVMSNTIHDSIIFYIPDEILNESFAAIKQTMENLPLQEYFGKSIDNIPIQVDFETSKISWKDLTAVK